MIQTTNTASITDLRQTATALIKQINEQHDPLFILQHSEVSAVLLDPQTYNELVEAYQDFKDYALGSAALKDKHEKSFSLKQLKAMKK